MHIDDLLKKLEEYNDSYEDIFNRELHNLTDEESEQLTVKEFLLKILGEEEGE